MPDALIEYRVRIRNASTVANPNGTADALELTSIRGGTNPYIAEPPSGDGTQFDPIAGAVRTGTYSVLIADAITSGTNRVVTAQLVNAQNRQQLLGRRVYVELREDGGAWERLIAGFMIHIRLVDAITYELQIGDTRRVERTKRVFRTDDATYFPIRGTLFGGPIIGGNIGPIKARGGWTFQVATAASAIVAMNFVNGYDGANGNVTTRWSDLAKPVRGVVGSRDQFCTFADSYYQLYTTSAGIDGAFIGLSYRVYTTAGVYVGSFRALQTFAGDITGGYAGVPHIRMEWVGVSLPTPGVNYLVNLLTDEATEACPLYLTGNPADIVESVYLSTGFTTDATSFNDVADAIGADLRVTMRITESQVMADFLENALQGPFGIGTRTNESGEIEAFNARIKLDTVPAVTITTDDLQHDMSPFDVDEQTVVTKVHVEGKRLAIWDKTKVPTRDGEPIIQKPFDGIMQNDETYEIGLPSGDQAQFGEKEVTYSIPGMVHTGQSFNSILETFATGVGREIFDRYGTGAQAGDAAVLRGRGADAVKIGEEVYFEPADLPNAGKRFGDDPSVGARIMQVVRRTESPAGPEFHLLDSGSAAQPATAATVSIAASATNPYNTATFTITNAAALNATGVIAVAVEWATGTGTPSSPAGIFTRYLPGLIPTGGVDLPPVRAGTTATTVWVRVRSEQGGRRPSAWSAWTSVVLTALTAPTGVATSNIRRSGATITWTNTISTMQIQVFAAPSGAADPVDPMWLVTTLPPASTRTTIRSLAASSTYTISVRYILPNNSAGPAGTVSLTTNTTADTLLKPAGITIITSGAIQDAGLLVGVAIGVWASDPIWDIEIERAPDVAGSPGTYALIARVPGTTRVYQDTSLPSTSATYWYRMRSVLEGYTASGYTCAKSAVASALPVAVERPDTVLPIIAVETFQAQGSVTATMRLTITDPQCRVDFVEARTKVDPAGWSAFAPVVASPAGVYTVTVNSPSSGFGWINMRVQGYDAKGDYSVLFDQTNAWDANTVPNIVIMEASFDVNGTLVVRVTADDDTGSVFCAVSTSGYPSQATTLATSPQNGRNVEFTFAGGYSIGQSVYISAIGAASAGGAGAISDTFNMQAIRFNTGDTKTVRLPAASVLSVFDSATQTADITNTYYSTILLVGNFGFIPVPKGATLTAVRARTYVHSRSISNDYDNLFLFRVDQDGARTQLGSTAQSAVADAWETIAVTSLSESTAGDRSYLVEVVGVPGSGVGTNEQRCAWIEYDLTISSVTVNT